jgi:protein-tyrosine-phosphatase
MVRLLAVWMITACLLCGCHSRQKVSSVVFVCEHGSVKSVIASEWFNRIAAEQQIPLRSISLGISPDKAVPKKILENLKADGFDLTGFKPAHFEAERLSNEVMVVSIGVDLENVKDLKIENWSDIPPASTNYTASREAIREHIQTLLKQLKQ